MRVVLVWALLLVPSVGVAEDDAAGPWVEIEIDPLEVTVGDPLTTRLPVVVGPDPGPEDFCSSLPPWFIFSS